MGNLGLIGGRSLQKQNWHIIKKELQELILQERKESPKRDITKLLIM
nr:MAG TPA: hypothetical protein [Caudoviricetes sp.]